MTEIKHFTVMDAKHANKWKTILQII